MCRIQHYWLYLIEYAHNDLFGYLNIFHIAQAIINARTSKFDTIVVVNVTFDISSGLCKIRGFVINYTPAQQSFDLEWKESDMNR